MIYNADYDFEKILEMNPEIIAHIAWNLDTALFKMDDEGYSYYGFYVDTSRKAVLVTTKNRKRDTIRMIFNGSKVLRIESEDQEMLFPIGNNRITLNKFLREFFDVPHAIDRDDPDYANLSMFAENTRCQWVVIHKDTL